MKVAELVAQYLAFRQAAGANYRIGKMLLGRLVNVLGTSAGTDSLTRENVERALLANGRMARSSRTKKSTYSLFFRWCVARGFLTDIPAMPELPQDPPSPRPHIYSDDEIRRLLSARHQHKSRVQPECARMILLTTYTLGLRIHETLSLKVGDVDTASNVVTIRGTKFYKTRIVPYNSAVARERKDFLEWRESCGMPAAPEDPLFLMRNNSPVREKNFGVIFHWLRDAAGIAKADGESRSPRIHDLRHTFAVKRLLAWYREGRDVQSLLPKLSVYMGHSSVTGTSTYLTMTPDLLRASCERFERFAEGGGVHA